MNNAFKLIISIGVSLSAGFVGSTFTMPAISSGWYASLAKPALNPPAWIFGPVWTTLYVLMGIALFLVWSSYAPADAEAMAGKKASADKKEESGKSKRLAYFAFGIQMVLNALWSLIFFGLHSPGGALLEMIFLWLAILATIIAFAKISKPAAWLLVPYILWVSFAGYLNYAIWTLK